MQTTRSLSFSSTSPSFGSFSSAVDLAVRVVNESPKDQDTAPESLIREDESEFAFDCSRNICSQPLVTADEIFSNGQIRPYVYGIRTSPVESQTIPRRRRPLRELMSEERFSTTSNSSSEAEDDLNGVPPEMYCVWKPKKSNYGDEDRQKLTSSPSHSKIKSNLGGLSKRWKLLNLLYVRRNSHGDEKIVFPAPFKKSEEVISEEPPLKVVREEEARQKVRDETTHVCAV